MSALKIAGSLFCIATIGIVTGQDSKKKDLKGWNTAIVVTQALMMLLLWNTEFICGHLLGPIPNVVLAWIVLFFVSGICVYFRFKDEDKSEQEWIYPTFGVGNAVLFALALWFLRKKDCPPPPVRPLVSPPPKVEKK